MSKKRYRIESGCPQCGCTFTTVLSHEEMMEKYGDVPNIELECSECMARYTKKTEEACPDWAEDCSPKP
jgi:hypothetical protein